MDKKWKNITVKNSKNKKEKVVFSENSVEIIENKQIKKIFNYSEIVECNFSLSIYKHHRVRDDMLAFFNKYPDTHNPILILSMFAKSKSTDVYTLSLDCTLSKVFGIIKLNNLINNFNLKISEEKCIKNCVTIPLTLYALTNKKFNILGNPLSSVEVLIFNLTFTPLFFIFMPSYFSGNLGYNYGFVIFFPIIAILVSLFGIINEIKKINLRKNFTQNMISSDGETLNVIGEIEQYIITDNKVNISPAVYKYVHTNRYISLSLFLFNLLLIIFATLKVFYY